MNPDTQIICPKICFNVTDMTERLREDKPTPSPSLKGRDVEVSVR